MDRQPTVLGLFRNAKSDTTLATIDRHRFLFLVQETPTFALNVMSVMAARLRSRG